MKIIMSEPLRLLDTKRKEKVDYDINITKDWVHQDEAISGGTYTLGFNGER